MLQMPTGEIAAMNKDLWIFAGFIAITFNLALLLALACNQAIWPTERWPTAIGAANILAITLLALAIKRMKDENEPKE